jgi:sugar O-acyltransferase (sialic acid O-acetyltransferase NeuD family)
MERIKEVVVVGAGGHGKVVVSLLQELGYKVSQILDDDKTKWGSQILSTPIDGPVDKLKEMSRPRFLLAIGDNQTRLKVAEKYPNTQWLTAIHPKAWVHRSVKISSGTVVFAGSIIQPETVIGSHCIINTGVTIDHDCRIDDGVHLAPGCHLAGNVQIGRASFLGIGVSVIPNREIGKRTIVGAGAAVVKDLPDEVVAVGVPARIMRDLDKENGGLV